MPETRDKRVEWACRVLLTLQLILAIRGYIVFLQTEYQLVSPLIPQSTIYDISRPYVTASLISGSLMFISLWLYFANKKVATIIFAGISLISSQLWFYLFLR